MNHADPLTCKIFRLLQYNLQRLRLILDAMGFSHFTAADDSAADVACSEDVYRSDNPPFPLLVPDLLVFSFANPGE
ncbi:hypothetical protein D3C74_475620 [compost metagenome]